MLTWNELQTLRRLVNDAKTRLEILDLNNTFERREAYAIINQLRNLVGDAPQHTKPRHLILIK